MMLYGFDWVGTRIGMSITKGSSNGLID